MPLHERLASVFARMRRDNLRPLWAEGSIRDAIYLAGILSAIESQVADELNVESPWFDRDAFFAACEEETD